MISTGSWRDIPDGGLQAWWKADSLPVVADNSVVTLWSDSSGNGNSATTATSNVKYFNNQINGMPIVRLPNGTNLVTTASASMSQFTIISVSKYTRTTKIPSLITSSITGGITLGGTTDANLRMIMLPRGGSVMVTGSSNTGITSYFMRTSDYTSGAQNVFLNGTLDGTGTSVTAFTSGATMNIGTSPSNDFSGDIAEILVYDRVLSSDERRQVHSYLSDKYGLPTSDYINAFGNIKVWNGSSWDVKPVKVWDGSSWSPYPLNYWSGGSWLTTNY